MFAHSTYVEGILAVGSVYLDTIDVYLWLLCGIDGCHDNVGSEGLAGIKGGLLGYDERIEPVYTDILDVDIGYESMKHLSLGIAYVALQLGKKGDSSCYGHALEHVFLPVLAKGIAFLRQFGR